MAQKADIIHLEDYYFGKVGHSIKNPILRAIIGKIFSDRVKKENFNYGLFSLSFKDTEQTWYTNFMNGFFKRVKCFFTDQNDMFLVFPVFGRETPRSFIIPEKKEDYVEERNDEWKGKGKEWNLDQSTVKYEEKIGEYILEYQGEWRNKGEIYRVFEYTVFKGIHKVVLQAFLAPHSDAFGDVEKIAKSIKVYSHRNWNIS